MQPHQPYSHSQLETQRPKPSRQRQTRRSIHAHPQHADLSCDRGVIFGVIISLFTLSCAVPSGPTAAEASTSPTPRTLCLTASSPPSPPLSPPAPPTPLTPLDPTAPSMRADAGRVGSAVVRTGAGLCSISKSANFIACCIASCCRLCESCARGGGVKIVMVGCGGAGSW